MFNNQFAHTSFLLTKNFEQKMLKTTSWRGVDHEQTQGNTIEPCYEKTCLRGFRTGKTQTGLLS